jgi:hypothetical protein
MKKIIIAACIVFAFYFEANAQNFIVLNKNAYHKDGEEYVLISKEGKIIKSLKGMDYFGNSEDRIGFKDSKTRNKGYLSAITGEWAIKPEYKNVTDHHNFSEGLAVMVCNSDNVGIPTMSAVIDKNGKIILPFCNWIISDFHEGMAVVEKEGYSFGAIDNTGKLVIPFSVGLLSDFKNGFAIKSNNPAYVDDYADETGLWGFMDKSGNLTTKLEWSWVYPYSEGLAAVKNKKGKWGYIDPFGKVIIPCTYESGGDFSEGYAAVSIGTNNPGITKMTFIDNTGKRATNLQFDVARDFKEGMAAVVQTRDPAIAVDPNDTGQEDLDYKFGFIDENFKLVIPMIHYKANDIGYYLQYFSFKDGLCPTSKGYIDRYGKLVLSFPEFKSISVEPFYAERAIVTGFYNNGTFRNILIDKTGKKLWESELNKNE